MLPQANENSSGPDLAPIRKKAMEAVSVMFNRAIEIEPDAPIVEDKKTVLRLPLPSKGALQDCEFGMMLLLVRAWMQEDLFAAIDRSTFERVVTALVKMTVNRVLDPLEIDEGGGGEHAAFFTGEPYSKHTKSGPTKYSANLDAAMITVAFLALAVEHFNDSLNEGAHELQNAKLPKWVKSLRDVSLFVILEGLKYAMECRVTSNGKFQGFTCDPDSNKEHPEDGYLKREDRLFFTWTACETINDLTEWRDTYLDKSLTTQPPPAQAVIELKSLISNLEETLRQSADWCATEFLEEFERLEAKDPKELVREINQLKGRRLSDKQKVDIADLGTCVQHVYQLSQYAAIRSLVPKSVSLQEVRTILDKIDLLVSRSILASGLDDSDQPDLFLTLTRKYSLGKWESYSDDAWYPLVVRSLSGLLSRTLRDIVERESSSKREVLALTLTFERTLENHVKNLIDRRPSGGENNSDGALWSFAAGQPYVLYATQRTVFALMKYEDFLVEVDKFKVDIFTESASGVSEPEVDLSTLLARKLAETYFRPIISEMLSQVPLSETGLLPARAGREISLPEEPWAADVVRNWLASLTIDFKRAQVAANIDQRISDLIRVKKCVENYQPSESLEPRFKKSAVEQLDILKKEYQSICNCAEIGAKLSELPRWESGTLTGILFEYLFQNYRARPNTSFEDLLDKESSQPELWKLIKEAKGTQDNISKIDKTATFV